MALAIQLLDCPFCGDKMKCVKIGEEYGIFHDSNKTDSKCIGALFKTNPDRDLLVKLWNTRSVSTAKTCSNCAHIFLNATKDKNVKCVCGVDSIPKSILPTDVCDKWKNKV